MYSHVYVYVHTNQGTGKKVRGMEDTERKFERELYMYIISIYS